MCIRDRYRIIRLYPLVDTLWVFHRLVQQVPAGSLSNKVTQLVRFSPATVERAAGISITGEWFVVKSQRRRRIEESTDERILGSGASLESVF